MSELVLSLFPGIGLLDQAFEEVGFCVVRGPDLLWGGDIKKFHPPAGRFDGVIGGPPCKAFSSLANIVRARYGEGAVVENLIPEFERCVAAAQPRWFLMENVRRAPPADVPGYGTWSGLLNNRSFGASQNRVRRFSFGVRDHPPVSLLKFIQVCALEHPRVEAAVLAGHGGSGTGLKICGTRKDGSSYSRSKNSLAKMNVANMRTVCDLLELQGLPRNMLDAAPLTDAGKREVIGNGVPLPMGRALAQAVRAALERL